MGVGGNDDEDGEELLRGMLGWAEFLHDYGGMNDVWVCHVTRGMIGTVFHVLWSRRRCGFVVDIPITHSATGDQQVVKLLSFSCPRAIQVLACYRHHCHCYFVELRA